MDHMLIRSAGYAEHLITLVLLVAAKGLPIALLILVSSCLLFLLTLLCFVAGGNSCFTAEIMST